MIARKWIRFLACFLSILAAPVAWAAAPLPHMQDLLAATNHQAMAADILAIGCGQFPLSKNVKEKHCTSPVGDRMALARIVDKAVDSARADITAHYSRKHHKAISRLAKKTRFQLASQPGASEALALYDFMVNRVITHYLLKGLRHLMDNNMDMGALAAYAQETEALAQKRIETVFYDALVKNIRAQQAGKPNAHHIVYASIGCGSAQKDMLLLAKLHADFNGYTITPYCIDPYQNPNGHAFAASGVLDTTPLATGEAMLTRLEKDYAPETTIYVLSGHYAFHHLGQSLGVFRQAARGLPTLLYETTVNNDWYGSFIKRQTKIIYDLLINYGLDHANGSNWVSDAASNHPDYFQVYYLNRDAISDKEVATMLGSNQVILDIN